MNTKFPYSNLYSIFVNIGAIIGTIISTTIPSFGLNHIHEYTFISYVGVLFLAVLSFVFGCRCYYNIKQNESIFLNFPKVLFNAINIVCCHWCKTDEEKPLVARLESDTPNSSHNLTMVTKFHVKRKPKTFLDNATVEYGGRFNERIVDEAKCLVKAVTMFTLLIPYWLIYNQVRHWV